ncbi:MATE family efflux transporter [Flavobacterium sp. LS1R47]|uniref:MATE family efflux transporter n=1 Tax=Flavobacterium frigoritolerans TaxID=2987686 RepID=A0A9X2ZIA5_9FLAO|nr:oligosaccharide flippase family protein [Flavobacterium frigoritolerans]MCV9931280.1 MATE family efflux transporter [Flavobacterium frigoritolerans]
MLDFANFDADKRTKNIKLQIYFSFFLRGISIFLSFFVVRITLGYLGKDLYGIWIVLLSIISWLSLFDIGVGNGLRNKLTITLTNNDLQGSRVYISTAYIILASIAFVLLILFGSSIYLVNWTAVFNSRILSIEEYRLMMFLFLFSIVFSFVLGLINSILNAYQQTAMTNIISIITNFIFILFLIVFKTFFLSNIVKIVFIYCVSLVVSHLVLTFWFFTKHKNVVPSLSFFSKSKIKDVLSLGGSFFVIQIAVLLIFTVDNYIILQLLGTEQVSVYNIVYKLFSIFTIAFGIIISPLWSAFTEANERKDFVWMKSAIKKLNLLFLVVVLGLMVMLFVYQPILDIWLPAKSRITPPFNLIIALSFFVIISIWNNIYSFFLNGLGIVRIQVQTSIIGALLNVPLAIFLVKYSNLGLVGVVYSMCFSLVIFSIFGPIVTYKFFKNNHWHE